MTEDKNALQLVAERLAVKPQHLKKTIKTTIAPEIKNDAQFLSYIAIANAYKLNPLRDEIYAFPTKGGGVKTIVPIDGWLSIINQQGTIDGVETVENREEGKVISITCTIYHKDRNHPTVVTEYMNECMRTTDPWKKWPIRMLRHKAIIQCARVAFGLSGIYSEDEIERYEEVEAEEITEPQAKEPEKKIDLGQSEDVKQPETNEKEDTINADKPSRKEKDISQGEVSKKEKVAENGNKSDLEAVEIMAESPPGNCTPEDIERGLGIMERLVGPAYKETLETFGVKKKSDISSEANAKMILQVLIERYKDEN